MKFSPRKMSLFAAAASVTAALWIASPAMAEEINPPGKQAAGVASVKTASAPARRHHHMWPRYRVASWYTARLRYADAAPVGWHSYYYWSPRPALLMVGIAY
jgi:hypothetical protein